jgi:hypothetical protein
VLLDIDFFFQNHLYFQPLLAATTMFDLLIPIAWCHIIILLQK